MYGWLRSRIPPLFIGFFVFLMSAGLWLVLGKKAAESSACSDKSRSIFKAEIAAALIANVICAGLIVYSAIPHNGALSFKLHDFLQKKEIKLVCDNFLESGAESIMEDLDEALGLPDELYIASHFSTTFDENGKIEKIYAFLYGRKRWEKTEAYLVDYDVNKSDKITVWRDGYAYESYDEDMRLEPMPELLETAPLKKHRQRTRQSDKKSRRGESRRGNNTDVRGHIRGSQLLSSVRQYQLSYERR